MGKAGNGEASRGLSLKGGTPGPAVTSGGVQGGATYISARSRSPHAQSRAAVRAWAAGAAATSAAGRPTGWVVPCYTATATDNAGNTTLVQAACRAVCRFDGFLPPVNGMAHRADRPQVA